MIQISPPIETADVSAGEMIHKPKPEKKDGLGVFAKILAGMLRKAGEKDAPPVPAGGKAGAANIVNPNAPDAESAGSEAPGSLSRFPPRRPPSPPMSGKEEAPPPIPRQSAPSRGPTDALKHCSSTSNKILPFTRAGGPGPVMGVGESGRTCRPLGGCGRKGTFPPLGAELPAQKDDQTSPPSDP